MSVVSSTSHAGGRVRPFGVAFTLFTSNHVGPASHNVYLNVTSRVSVVKGRPAVRPTHSGPVTRYGTVGATLARREPSPRSGPYWSASRTLKTPVSLVFFNFTPLSFPSPAFVLRGCRSINVSIKTGCRSRGRGRHGLRVRTVSDGLFLPFLFDRLFSCDVFFSTFVTEGLPRVASGCKWFCPTCEDNVNPKVT